MERDDQSRISAALLAALRPLAAMLLRFGIGYREFADACKTAFVLAATDEFGVRGRPTNVSRVAAMTGLSRKEVRRIRDQAGEHFDPPPVRSAPAEVLHRWHTDPAYMSGGRPRPLALDGPAPSFATLVHGCAGDIPPGAIRAELRRVGAIVEMDGGLLEARRRYFVPEGPAARLVEGVGFGLRTLGMTVAHNAAASMADGLRFQRLVHNHRVDPARREEVEAHLQGRLQDLSEEIDDYLAEVEGPAGAGIDLGVGLYVYADAKDPAPGPRPLP